MECGFIPCQSGQASIGAFTAPQGRDPESLTKSSCWVSPGFCKTPRSREYEFAAKRNTLPSASSATFHPPSASPHPSAPRKNSFARNNSLPARNKTEAASCKNTPAGNKTASASYKKPLLATKQHPQATKQPLLATKQHPQAAKQPMLATKQHPQAAKRPHLPINPKSEVE